MNNTLDQGYIFCCAIYGGLIIGAVYDMLSLARKWLRERKAICVVLDILFCILTAALILAVLFYAASGQIRIFSLLGFMAGFALYMAGLRRLWRGIARRIHQKNRHEHKKKTKKSGKTEKK